jgi:hypothetical protein
MHVGVSPLRASVKPCALSRVSQMTKIRESCSARQTRTSLLAPFRVVTAQITRRGRGAAGNEPNTYWTSDSFSCSVVEQGAFCVARTSKGPHNQTSTLQGGSAES